MKRTPTLLLVSAPEDSEPILRLLEEEQIGLLHLPLEKYVEAEDMRTPDELAEALGEAENVIYGHRRNAEFFLRLAKREGLLERTKQRVNLAADADTAELLEEEGIPAVHPESDKPIKMMEFMLRLRRTGPVLYPCGSHMQEEIPGLLQELDIPVTEHVLYELEGPSEEELVSYREQVSNDSPDLIICHSRRSVNRLRAAFPDLDYKNARIIAGDRGVFEKLEEVGLQAGSVAVAGGTWQSMFEKVMEAR